MVERIIDLSVKNRFILIFITLLLAFGSIYAIKNTSLDAIPDLSANQVIIEVEWSNQSAKTIRSEERRVGKECASMCRSRWSPYH